MMIVQGMFDLYFGGICNGEYTIQCGRFTIRDRRRVQAAQAQLDLDVLLKGRQI
jgi:hypothetical protein